MIESTTKIGDIPAVRSGFEALEQQRWTHPDMYSLCGELQSFIGMPIGHFVQSIRAEILVLCGAPHEGGFSGYTSSSSVCVLRDGNLGCGHPEQGLSLILRSGIFLAELLGLLSAGSPLAEIVQDVRTVLHVLTEESSGLRGMDKGAQYALIGRRHPSEEMHPNFSGVMHYGNRRLSVAKGLTLVKSVQAQVGQPLKVIRDQLLQTFDAGVERMRPPERDGLLSDEKLLEIERGISPETLAAIHAERSARGTQHETSARTLLAQRYRETEKNSYLLFPILTAFLQRELLRDEQNALLAAHNFGWYHSHRDQLRLPLLHHAITLQRTLIFSAVSAGAHHAWF